MKYVSDGAMLRQFVTSVCSYCLVLQFVHSAAVCYIPTQVKFGTLFQLNDLALSAATPVNLRSAHLPSLFCQVNSGQRREGGGSRMDQRL